MTDVINGKISTSKYQRIEYISCTCSSPDHTLRIVLDRGDPENGWLPELYTEVQLSDYPGFFGRAWRALRYVFGYKCRYGHWDCTIFEHTDVLKLRDVLNEYDKLVDEFEKSQLAE